jgi:parallel beta-helix repeat protein
VTNGSGTATWTSADDHTGSQSVNLTTTAGGDYAAVAFTPIGGVQPFSNITTLSFWFKQPGAGWPGPRLALKLNVVAQNYMAVSGSAAVSAAWLQADGVVGTNLTTTGPAGSVWWYGTWDGVNMGTYAQIGGPITWVALQGALPTADILEVGIYMGVVGAGAAAGTGLIDDPEVNTVTYYGSIQDAIDTASSGDTVNVAAGTYTEYVHITTDNLTVQGAGIDVSIIDLDGLMPYWHYSGSGSYASRSGVHISGYGSPDEIVENVTFKGFTVKNAGLNPPGGGSYIEFVDPEGNGQDNVRGLAVANGKTILIQNCKVENSGFNGIGIGKARLTTLKQSEGVTIDNCTSSDNWETGITVGDYVGAITITDNTCSNNKRPHPTPPREFSGKGIEVSGKSAALSISGVISGNTCSNNGFEGIVLKNYSDGVIIENNIITGHNVDDDGAGIFFYGKSSTPANCVNNIIRNNTITGNIRGVVAYYAQDCTIAGNTITTDAGTFSHGQAGIKIDGSNGMTVIGNTISCDGIGIQVQNTWNDVESYDNCVCTNTIDGAEFAGIAVWGGAHDNEFLGNTITGTTSLTLWAGEAYEETQADGVFIDDDAGTGNVFHYNGIYGNDGDAMENQIATQVDAENNWWGVLAGTSIAAMVSGDVDYDPWLKTSQIHMAAGGARLAEKQHTDGGWPPTFRPRPCSRAGMVCWRPNSMTFSAGRRTLTG